MLLILPFAHVSHPLMAQLVKNPPAMRETWFPSLGGEDPLEKGTATHSSILAWRIQSMGSMGSQRGGHDWVTFTHSLPPLGLNKSKYCSYCASCWLSAALQISSILSHTFKKKKKSSTFLKLGSTLYSRSYKTVSLRIKAEVMTGSLLPVTENCSVCKRDQFI